MENPETKAVRSPPSESQYEEPDTKKLKMSTTTSDDDEQVPATDSAAVSDGVAVRKPKYKRRKIAMFFAYCGVGYQGMQKNPGAKTIEGELEEALYHSGAVPESERGNPRAYDWARSARTDKGVSAVGQVISGRFYIDPPGLVDRLNSNLPGQIRIFGYKRATPSFNAKKFCDRRRYVYLIPVFALDSRCHRDRDAVMASLGSGQEFVKCSECSDRGRKVVGVMGRFGHDSKSVAVQSGISSNTLDAIESAHVKDETVVLEDSGVGDNTISESAVSIIHEGNTDSDSKMAENGQNYDLAISSEQNELPDSTLMSSKELTDSAEEEKANGEEKPVTESKFCYGKEEKESFNRILQHYVGSHNFHNFTTRTKAEDPSARRYIISFHANTTVNVDGIEFVKCEVVGQSFMLHQIRKMIGLAVAIMRNSAPESLIETAFRKDVKITVPMAPEVGLYLDECFFTSYNKKWQGSHEELSMKAYEDEAEDFKMKHIYSHIASTERKEGAVALWLHSLNHRNYPDLRVAETKNHAEEKADAETENHAEEKVDAETENNAEEKVDVPEKDGDASGTEASREAIEEQEGTEDKSSAVENIAG